MKYVGIDLHKKSIAICVVDRKRKVRARQRLSYHAPEKIVEAFRALGKFEAVVEATAGYEWLFALLEPLASKLVLAHPGKMRVIAESVKKTDKLDAQVLAEFLALGMIPRAYRPTPRERQHRRLVSQRAAAAYPREVPAPLPALRLQSGPPGLVYRRRLAAFASRRGERGGPVRAATRPKPPSRCNAPDPPRQWPRPRRRGVNAAKR